MRVLFNLHDAQIGGGQRVAAHIANGLAARGHKVGIMIGRQGPALDWFQAAHPSVHMLGLTSLRQPLAVLGAVRLIRKYDVLYSHAHLGGQLAGEVAARLAGRAHVIHQHNVVRFSVTGWIAAIQRRLYPRLLSRSMFIAVAGHVKTELVASGFAREHVVVIPNGVEVTSLGGSAVKNSRLRIGMLGRLDPQKGMDIFLEAVPLIGRESAEFVIGASRGASPDYEAKTRNDAAALGVEVVEPGSGGVAFLDSLDIVCMPSRHEGLPLVLLESLALGKPVVASDIAGIREVVGESGAAQLVAATNVRELANAVTALMGNVVERRRLSEIGHRLVRSRYSVDKMVESTVSTLESFHGHRTYRPAPHPN
jgi:glycosyltransferase involved in cell wall biosynthesis